MRSPLVLLPALLAGLLLALAPASADDIKIGKIDTERVFKEYKLYAQLVDEYDAFRQKLINRAEQRAKRYSLLLDEEWNRLVELLDKGPNLTTAEKSALEELQKLNNDRDQELVRLSAKPDLKDDERKKYQELVAKQTQARQGIEDLKNRVQQQIKDRYEEVSAQLDTKVAAAVEKVANDKKLTVVLIAKDVLFGGLDVTDDVVKVLNAAPPGKPGKPGKPVEPAPPTENK